MFYSLYNVYWTYFYLHKHWTDVSVSITYGGNTFLSTKHDGHAFLSVTDGAYTIISFILVINQFDAQILF